MALAGRTRIKEAQQVLVTNIDIDMPTSYTTGGDALGVRDFVRVGRILGVLIEPKAGYNFRYDEANDTVLAYRTGAINAAEEEVPATTDISAAVGVRVMIFHTPA